MTNRVVEEEIKIKKESGMSGFKVTARPKTGCRGARAVRPTSNMLHLLQTQRFAVREHNTADVSVRARDAGCIRVVGTARAGRGQRGKAKYVPSQFARHSQGITRTPQCPWQGMAKSESATQNPATDEDGCLQNSRCQHPFPAAVFRYVHTYSCVSTT